MIFRQVEIRNLFSYRHALFDLEGAGRERNLVLISGRYGYGKTSFLNAVKLLFVGPNPDMCRSVQQGMELKPRQYVEGFGEAWMGIMNAHARRDGEHQCSVTIVWDEEAGEVEAARRWDLDGGDFMGRVAIDVRGERARHLEGDKAQVFLGERLPEDFLSFFFFFDGEQIQRLAEANRSQQTQQVERLLNISPVETLIEFLERVIKNWRKEAMTARERAGLVAQENELEQAEAALAANEEKRGALRGEQEDLERRIREEDLYLEGRKVATLARDALHLTEERDRLEAETESLQHRLAKVFIPTVPLLCNPELVGTAAELVQRLSDSEVVRQAQEFRSVLDSLPADLFDKPPFPTPPLQEGQTRFLKRRLCKWIETYIEPAQGESHQVIAIDQQRARELGRVLAHFAESATEQEQRRHDLREISAKKRRLAEILDRLDDLTSLPPEERQEYRRRKAANDERNQRLGAIQEEIKQLATARRDLERTRNEKAKEVRSQERRVRVSEDVRKRLDLAEKMKALFVGYKAELKRRKRGAVEEAINRRFAQLMSSHHLISHICVDEQFGLHFKTAVGSTLGMANFSEGMKQLVITSLLWALKEVSGKRLPVIIDTPLARIDGEHQQNLLRHYYPFAGEQVIILPTDSELDEAKYRQLLPRVYREYTLENPEGDATRVVTRPLYARDPAHV